MSESQTTTTTTTTTAAVNEQGNSNNNDNTVAPPPAVVAPPQPNFVKHESSLAPFNPTCNQAQGTTLRMLNLSKDDVLFDLGCGDGRMLLHAAANTPGLRCVGIELDPVFVNRGREALKELPIEVQQRVDIREGDLLQLLNEIQQQQQQPTSSTNDDTTALNGHENGSDEDAKKANGNTDKKEPQTNDNGNDEKENESYEQTILGKECRELTLFGDATALYMFLLPKGIKKIQGLLDALVQRRKKEKRSFHVVAYMFSIREWEPRIVDKTTKGDAPLYLYKFVAEKDKEEDN